MKKIIIQALKKAILFPKHCLMPTISGDDAEKVIYDGIMRGDPFMVARLGAVEIKALIYCKLGRPLNVLLEKYIYLNMRRNAGFFPITESNLRSFYSIMYSAMLHTDVIGSWRPEELLFRKELHHTTKIDLGIIGGPHDTTQSWTRALRNKRVLVVHPFADTIEKQYRERRKLLFDNPDFLPEFASLETIEAVQTVAGNNAGFRDWFEALEYMKTEINKRNFDVCILGCGAYGYPLAAYVKSIGKIALHIGGPVQLHFGIKGRRWDNSGLYNEFWVSPSYKERPQNYDQVENGCYW